MKIKLDTTKSLEQNAETYYNAAKKMKKKLGGAREAIKRTEEMLKKAEKEFAEEKPLLTKRESVKKEWYEKFRWFFSSEGFLCIGGRDSTSNEIIIKKHMEKEDIVFHTEMAGSPFFLIKTEGKKPGEKTLNEAAQATASFSRAWKLGMSAAEVFYVNPEQVTKEAKAGEYISKGAFMIYGKKNFIGADMKIAIGLKDGKLISGPLDAIKPKADRFFVIAQGDEKTSSLAKKLQKKLGFNDLDEIIRMLPVGNCKIL